MLYQDIQALIFFLVIFCGAKVSNDLWMWANVDAGEENEPIIQNRESWRTTLYKTLYTLYTNHYTRHYIHSIQNIIQNRDSWRTILASEMGVDQVHWTLSLIKDQVQ